MGRIKGWVKDDFFSQGGKTVYKNISNKKFNYTIWIGKLYSRDNVEYPVQLQRIDGRGLRVYPDLYVGKTYEDALKFAIKYMRAHPRG